MIVTVDISDEEALPDLGLASDGPGDRYLLVLVGVELTINYDQLESLYKQMRGWFEEEA